MNHDVVAWTRDELKTIGGASKLNIALLRPDGTPRSPVPVWVVLVGDHLYVRSWHGPRGGWYRSAQLRREAMVNAGGHQAAVALVHVNDEEVNEAIDNAYRDKYGRSSYVAEMVRPQARATTLRLLPKSSDPG